jgi:hypothetical protein
LEFKFPVIELVDRYTIARVKHNKTEGANQAELDFYQQQIDQLDITKIKNWLVVLEELHAMIWVMEDDFKKCRIDGTDLAEVGRRALAIRDHNNLRIQVKNHMAGLLGDPVREIKTTL